MHLVEPLQQQPKQLQHQYNLRSTQPRIERPQPLRKTTSTTTSLPIQFLQNTEQTKRITKQILAPQHSQQRKQQKKNYQPHRRKRTPHSKIKHLQKQLIRHSHNHNRNLMFHRRSRLWNKFGFIPNNNISIYKNAQFIHSAHTFTLNQTSFTERLAKSSSPPQHPLDLIYKQPTNRKCHNLCTGTIQPPTGALKVLGLGLNYCLTTPTPAQAQKPERTLTRLHRDVRLGCWFDKFNGDFSTPPDKEQSDYDPKLYVKDDSWMPSVTNEKIEARFDRFAKTLLNRHAALPSHKQYNTTAHERYVIKNCAQQKEVIYGNTDKNLGPFAAPRPTYIQDCLNGHLLKQDYYQLLSTNQMNTRIHDMQTSLGALLHKHRPSISHSHLQYFDRSLSNLTSAPRRIAQFYGNYKVHKKKLAVRPVITCCGTYAQIFSKYIDHWMKKIVQSLLPTYIKNAESLINDLQARFPNRLPVGTMLFSIDAINMYGNIDTDHGIETARKFLRKFKDRLPQDCPTEFILDALELVMKNNIFQFGDTNWLQLIGCAMGTSAAVNYSYIYIGYLEITELLVNYQDYLLFYRRYIDDGIGCWNCSLPDSQFKFKEFLNRLNQFGKLRWTNTGFVRSLEFMDLTISIKNRSLHFKTFQKEHCLYLYIPPLSAHPQEMIRGLIFGRLRTYYKHNTDFSDYIDMSHLLAQRLIARGWNWKDIEHIFNAAHNRITGKTQAKNRPYQGQPLIIHAEYHPRGLQRSDLNSIFKTTLGTHVPNQTIIALSRPKNLGDRLVRSKLPDVPNMNPSDYLNP